MKTAALPQELAARSDEVRSTVAYNLDAALKGQRWSRRAAATALGLTHTYVNSRAAGDTDLSASDLVMFADFLSMPVSAFFQPIPTGNDNVTDITSNPRTLVPKVAGSTPVGGTIIPFQPRERAVVEHVEVAPVTPIARARA